MGGYGSGRRGGRETTADYRRLDVRELHRAGVLTPGWRGGWNWYRNGKKRASINIEVHELAMVLRYSATTNGERKSYDYAVGLSWTGCTFGGKRPWMLCPCCGRRVAMLFGGAVFACRHCHKLAYESQRETSGDRAIRRADAIRKRMGWPAGFLNGLGDRPKHMRHSTYLKLLTEYNALVQIGLQDWARQFGIMESRLVRAEAALRQCNASRTQRW